MKYFRVFLALVLVTTGCGTTYKNFPPAEITKRDQPQIEKPMVTKISDGEVYDPIDQNYFDQKISEIKGKISYYHPKDSAFTGIYNRTEGLALQQDSMRVDNNINSNISAFTGALIVSLVGFVCTSIGGSNKTEGEGWNFDRITWFLTLPLQFAGGALLGVGVSGITKDPDISENHKKELTQLIDDYNSLNIPKVAPDTVVNLQK